MKKRANIGGKTEKPAAVPPRFREFSNRDEKPNISAEFLGVQRTSKLLQEGSNA